MNEPRLRFKADDGSQFPDWEEKTLGDIGTAKMCKRVLKEQTSENGEVPFYKIGTFGGTPDAFISRELYEELKTKYSFPRKGNILLSAAGTIGRTVVYDGQDAFFQDSNIVWLANDDSVLDGFLLQFYNKTSWDNLEGGTIKRLYNGLFLSKVIHVPSLPEQQKIAEFLSTVDTVIEKQKETVSAWEERKKGVMQKLFSQEVRFKADDGSEFPEWEEKNVGSLGNIVGGGTPSTKQKEYWCGKTAWVSSADISDNDIYNINMTRFITQDAIDDSATKIIPKGSILIVSRVGVGKVAKASCDLCTSQDFTNIVNPDGDATFLSYAILRLMQSKLQCVQGTSIKGIPSDEIKNYMLRIPCLAEQQKIADCLSSLDEVIEKQKATLAAWEEMKKGLLQQMFV